MPNIAFYIIYTHAYQNGGKIRKNYIKKKTPNIGANDFTKSLAFVIG